MSILSISLLGSPQVAIDGIPQKIPSSRAIPLLAYLALNRDSQTRETLANLLWTESNQNQALAALRTMLWRLKRTGLDDWIAWDRNDISLQNSANLDIDVVEFQAVLDRCSTHGHSVSSVCLNCTPSLTQAVSLYRGEFLKGFNITKAPAFDDWRMQQSGTFETLYLNALERLVKCHRTFGDFNLAIQYARTWLNVDRLNENSHIQLLQLYSITGQRSAAITLFKHYKNNLFRELAIQPTEEITSLYKEIVSGRSIPVLKPNVKTPVIMIADIERAALYWAEVAEKKNQVLNTYMNIVKGTSRRFGGNILQKTDDTFTILFETGQPLHFAVTLHLMLKKADWGTCNPPNIRIVLYSTTIENENSENFALLTQAASSLLSISWGGQIVFTDQTMRFLDIPSGSTIKDLGFHFLNDTEGSVHVFELHHPHLPRTEHPPLLSSAQKSFNIPNFDPPFIGRDLELEELRRKLLLPTNRLVSLIGPGGVGKTRLAVEFASRAAEYFPDGIFFISFASIQDPEFIPILLADALKFNFYGPASFIEQLGKYLQRMRLLLIMDNFEHLRMEGARFLASMLQNTHQLKILVTSRERMNLIAETVLDVRGFPVPDPNSRGDAESFTSVQLFLQNAHKTFPRFSNQNNLEAIIRICQMLDGIPLGILLASSWVRVFSCSEIESEINQNIDFLSSSAPDLDPRHRSLSAVFNNSWKLLSEEERRVYRRLSIFMSAFTANVAREICNATPLVLSTLTDKSLLVQQADGRFLMLNTFNLYAAAKLAKAEDEFLSTREKFCDYYANFCDRKNAEINSRMQRNALSEMTVEIENIRMAWGVMIESNRWELVYKFKDALLAYHVILGNFYQGEELFGSAFSKLDRLNEPQLILFRTYMLQLSAWMEFRRGFTADSLKSMMDCLEFYRSREKAWDVAVTLSYIGEIHQTSGNLPAAKKFIEQAISCMKAESIPVSNYVITTIAHCQSSLGKILLGMGDYEQARQNFTTSLETQQKVGTPYGTISPLVGLGNLAFEEGEFIQARDLYHRALDEAININDHRGMILIHNNLSAVYEVIANIPESLHHILTALKLCKETGDRRLTAIIINNLAYQKLRYDNRPSEAIHSYHECLELFAELGDLRGIAYSGYDLSKAYIKQGLFDEAWKHCLSSLNIGISLESTPLILHAMHGFAGYYAAIGQPERALSLCYRIINHPEVGLDTQKRAIVSRVILEATLPGDTIWKISTQSFPEDYQDFIDQVLFENSAGRNN